MAVVQLYWTYNKYPLHQVFAVNAIKATKLLSLVGHIKVTVTNCKYAFNIGIVLHTVHSQ